MNITRFALILSIILNVLVIIRMIRINIALDDLITELTKDEEEEKTTSD